MTEKQRKEFEQWCNQIVNNNAANVKGHDKNKLVNGLNPLSIWEFVGVVDNATPGQLIPCDEDKFDEEDYKNDCLTARSLYEELINEAESPAHALCVLLPQAMFANERAAQTASAMMQEQRPEHDEAIRFLARAKQARFEYIEGELAVFHCTPLLVMADSMLCMRFKGDKAELQRRHLRLEMIAPRLEIPIEEGESANAFSSRAFEILMDIGSVVLDYVFAE